MNKKQDPKRRDFLKKAAYSAPAVLTLQAASGVAKAGSEKPATSPTEAKEAQADEAQEVGQRPQRITRSIDERDTPVSTRMSERGVRY